MPLLNPSVMTNDELEAELAGVEMKIDELVAKGSRVGELEARKFRLRAEKAFRQKKMEKHMNPADDIPKTEKRRILANDRKVMSSYLEHAQVSIDDDRGGRFAAVGKSATVVGASPTSYPQQPTNSPWARDVMPPEPPLGFSVHEIEPVGEKHEIARAAQSGNVSAKPWRRL